MLECLLPENENIFIDKILSVKNSMSKSTIYHLPLKTPSNIYCCSHNARGELNRINWSHFARDSHLDVDVDKVEDLYKAMRTFDDLMNREENHIRLKMLPGDMVTVANQRVLHGRSELQGGVSGRHLQCGYMDWDEIRSAIRVTRKTLGVTI